MEFSARKKNLRVSPRKLRLLVDVVRGRDVQNAIDSLRFSERRWSREVVMLIRSALSNATQSRGVNVDTLFVKKIFVDQGPTIKRFMTRARGSGAGILKRTSNLTVVLDEKA